MYLSHFRAQATHANRGNVAIIVWNTLEAPYVWDVKETEFEGTINLGNSTRSLLSIYFRDYADKEGNLKEIKEIEIEKEDIDDKQLNLTLTADEVDNLKFQAEPRKNKNEKSYKKDATKVLVYVPEEVVADLDELEDKCVTIILGEDNIAVAVIIEEDNTEKDFLTAYKAEKRRIIVGDEKYDLAEDSDTDNGYTVKLNGTKVDNIARDDEPIVEALKLALDDQTLDDDKDIDDIEKKIQAEIKLNDDDEVIAIELYVSRTISDYSFEALVTEVKETRTTYKIVTNAGTIYWDLEAEEDEEFDFPKVYIDGARASIRDIEAGNVITVMGADDEFEVNENTEDYEIYVSTKTVEAKGDDIDVKKKNNAIKVDGTSYLPTAKYAGTSDKELEDVESLDAGSNLLKITECENVVLHLNMFGEYYAALTTESTSTYTFGVVTWVDTNVTVSGDENEIQETRIRVLLADGSKAYYTLSLDTSDEDLEDIDVINDCLTTNGVKKGAFVMFEANADRVITVEDEEPVRVITDADDEEDVKLPGDYVVKALSSVNNASKDDEEFSIGTTDYEYDASETVIFSNYAENNKYNLEVVDKWSAIVDKDAKKFIGSAPFMVLADEDDEIPAYIVVAVPEDGYSSSDATYATVYRSVYKKGEDKFVQFVEDEPIEVKNVAVIESLTDVDGAFVEYAMGSSKVSKAAELLDTKEFKKLGLDDIVPVNVINSGYETVAVTHSGSTVNYVAKEHAADSFWGTPTVAGADLNKYVTVKLAGFVPATGSFELKTTSEAFGDLFTTMSNNVMITTQEDRDRSGSADTELGVLVKADGKVHEITFELTVDGKKTVEKLYVIASIDSSLSEDEITGYNVSIAKENFEVKKALEEKSKYFKLTYVDDEDEITNPLKSVKVDKDALVFDLRNGELVEVDIKDITKGDLVIAYSNDDCDEDAEANVLVIVK